MFLKNFSGSFFVTKNDFVATDDAILLAGKTLFCNKNQKKSQKNNKKHVNEENSCAQLFCADAKKGSFIDIKRNILFEWRN